MSTAFAQFIGGLIKELLGGTSPPDLPPPPLVTSFPDSVVEPGYVLDAQTDALTDAIGNDLATTEPFKSLPFAVVDLSSRSPAGQLPPPRFAGNLVQEQLQVDSMAKIAVMLAAHNLRADLRSLAASGAASDIVGLAVAHTQLLLTAPEQVVRDAAKPTTVQDLMPDSSGHRFQTMLGGPEVRHILDLTYDTGGWNVAFKTSNLTPAKLKQIYEAQNLATIAGLPFAERMRLMIRYSDNLAAASCIRDLGFPYIAALMRQIGLFDIPSQRGLWLALNYGDHTWDTHGTLFADVPYITNRRQSCTASAAAAFMTLLFQRRLLADVDANVDMRALLRIDLGSYSSYFRPKTTSADVRQPAAIRERPTTPRSASSTGSPRWRSSSAESPTPSRCATS